MEQIKKLRQNVETGPLQAKKGDILLVNGEKETIIAVDGKYYYTQSSQYRKGYKGIEGVKKQVKKKEKKEGENEPL